MFPLIYVINLERFKNFESDFEGSFGKSAEEDFLGMEKFIGKRKSLAYSADGSDFLDQRW